MLRSSADLQRRESYRNMLRTYIWISTRLMHIFYTICERDKLGLIQNGMQHFVSVSCLVQGGSTLSHLLLNDQINIFAFFDHSILMAWLSIIELKRKQRHIKNVTNIF